MPFVSKVKNKVLNGQSREIISNVLKFMQDEAEAAVCLMPISKVSILDYKNLFYCC